MNSNDLKNIQQTIIPFYFPSIPNNFCPKYLPSKLAVFEILINSIYSSVFVNQKLKMHHGHCYWKKKLIFFNEGLNLIHSWTCPTLYLIKIEFYFKTVLFQISDYLERVTFVHKNMKLLNLNSDFNIYKTRQDNYLKTKHNYMTLS